MVLSNESYLMNQWCLVHMLKFRDYRSRKSDITSDGLPILFLFAECGLMLDAINRRLLSNKYIKFSKLES